MRAKLCLILQHGNYRRDPPPTTTTSCTPGGDSPDTAAVTRKRRGRTLTSGGWVEGWSRSLTLVFLSSHSTISPPGRRCRCGRLPAAPAPSPSRTQVCSGGATAIQRTIIRQISHKSLRPLPPPHLSGSLSLHAADARVIREVSRMLQSRFDAHGTARLPSSGAS